MSTLEEGMLSEAEADKCPCCRGDGVNCQWHQRILDTLHTVDEKIADVMNVLGAIAVDIREL